MKSCSLSLTVASAAVAFATVLALWSCAPKVEESRPANDAITPKRTEMIEPFEGAELRITPPEKAAELPGLKIETKAEGQGEALNYGMLGKIHYIASLASGKIVASTYKSDAKPVLVRLIAGPIPKGVALGVDGAKVGERRLITVPPSLGYGAQDDFSNEVLVPKNSVLIYEVEVVEVLRDLKYKTLTEGSGPELQYGEKAKFHYTGVLAKDGTQFDSSVGRDPIEFVLKNDKFTANKPIDGWVFGLIGMKAGEKRRVRIPWALAYGEQGRAPTIGAKEDLIFDVELVQIVP